VVAQITHRGRRGRSIDLWNRMYAPSDVREPNHRENPHPMEPEVIDELVQAFVDAAGRLKDGGFDGCEVMASHCHLIDQFWNPDVNRRTDAYGGSLENRLRFGLRILEGIRARVGPGFVVGMRVTGDDFTERGLDLGQMQEICGRLSETRLLDYLNVIGSTAETYVGEALAVPNMSVKLGVFAHLAAAIRKVVDVPVIAGGRIVDPVQADRLLVEGQADLCIMNRSLIADPHMPNKARAGQLDDIRQCMGYNEGCIDRIYTGRGVTCVQNPVIGREEKWADLPPAGTRRTVVVAGGGPAGLEAARVAAARGHRVILFEREPEPGGQTLIAKRAPGRQDFDGATRWSSLQCRKLGVDLRLGTAASVEAILAERPDAVLVATGATARPPGFTRLEGHRVVSAWDVLQGRHPDLPRTILVVDEEYGHQGPTTAECLADGGHEVDLVTSQELIAGFLGATTRPPLLTRLFRKGVQIFNHLEAVRLEDGHLVARNIWSGDLRQVGPYEAIVYAYGGVSRDELSGPLRARGVAVQVVGDAFAPRSLQHAILEGHQMAREL
jgi:2,4-dienoyl-CoA reductase-like NADH-dependent reductase (Old Yellow Enzyme family)